MTAAKSMGRGRVPADRGTRSGFTIIEVVLVLAIAGLIFLMVFIALPVLQRSQRDTQRRSDIGKMASAIQQYQTNNNGRLPKTDATGVAAKEPSGDDDRVKISGNYDSTNSPAQSFIKNYMNGATAEYNEFNDPSGWAYGLKILEFAGDQPTLDFDEHIIYMYKGAHCNGELLEKSNNSRDYALIYKLEGASVYCTHNS